MAVHLFAAIDVGSYDLQMMIYQIHPSGKIAFIEHLRKIVAAGQDTYLSGRLSYRYVDEICQILKEFKQKIEEYAIDDYLAYGTSALREAENRDIILDQIEVRTGIKVQVLSNSEQRFLCYKAIALRENEFQTIIQKGTAIADIGSGSLQLSLYDKDALVTTQYMRLGAVRILAHLSDLNQEISEMTKLIEEMVDDDLKTFKRMYIKDREIKNIIATGQCALYLGRNQDKLTKQQFMQVYDKVITRSTYELSKELDVPVEHAKLMLPSMIIYKKLLELTQAEMLWLPGVSLCDGIVADYAEKKKYIKFTHDFSEDIVAAARHISKRYMGNKKHTQNLEKTALLIFDSMKRYHGMGKRERLLLQISAILQDCGKFVSLSNSADCAYNIIMSTEIIGLSHNEREIVANIVRYNTTGYDYKRAMENKGGKHAALITAKLVAILMIVNGMDRSYKQKFDSIKCVLKNHELLITTDSVEDITLEQSLFQSKADFFEEVYGIRPILKRKK